MAVTAITKVDLVLNTASADILDAGGTAAAVPADGWSVVWDGSRPLLLKLLADGSGDTVTVVAGDRPPSHRSGLGDLSIVLAASDVRYLVVEQGRFMHNDGKLYLTCSDAGTTLAAFELPRND